MTNYLFSDSLVQALGGALAHSIWQGVAVAAVLALLLPNLRTASGRYWAAYCTLIGFFVVAGATFWYLWVPDSEVTIAAEGLWPTAREHSPMDASGVTAPDGSVEEGMIAPILAKLEYFYPLLTAGWLIGFAFFLLKLCNSLLTVRQLRRRQVTPPPEIWQQRLATLSAQLGMRRKVVLLESALATVPLALGYFRPVILFPLGLINQLSPDETAAVLAHELAHIARRDWALNLLQSFVETIFYYHPAVWWISFIIRTEREQSCDDVAIALTGNRLIYAKALLHLAEKPIKAAPALALSARGWNHSRPLLLERVRRILQTSQPVSFTMEKIFATIALLAICLFCGLRANKDNPILQSALAQIGGPIQYLSENVADVMPADSIPKKNHTQTITRDDGNQKVHLEVKNGQITKLKIDGREIPPAEMAQYQALTDELRKELAAPPPPPPAFPEAPEAPEAPEDMDVPPPPAPPAIPRIVTGRDKDGNTTLLIERPGDPVELVVKDGNVWKDGRKLEEGETLEIMGLNPDGFFFWNDANAGGHTFTDGAASFNFSTDDMQDELRAAADEARAALDGMRNGLDDLRERQMELRRNLRENTKNERFKIQQELQAVQQEMQELQREMQREATQHLQNWRWSSEDAVDRAGDLNDMVQRELLQDGLIANTKSYSFELSAKRLEVNGKKQPDHLHEKYLDLYRRTTGKSLSKGDSIKYEVQE